MIQGTSGEFKGILRIQGKTGLMGTENRNLRNSRISALLLSVCCFIHFSLLSLVSFAPLIFVAEYGFPPCCGQHHKENKSFS